MMPKCPDTAPKTFIELLFQRSESKLDLDATFFDLPKHLQDKILPPHKLSEVQRLALTDGQYTYLDRLGLLYDQEKRSPAISTPVHIGEAAQGAERAQADRGAHAGQGQGAPDTNRGGKSTQDAPSMSGSTPLLPSFEALEQFEVLPIGKGGKYTLIQIPKPDLTANVQHSFIDWVTFTFKPFDFPIELNTGHPALSDHDYVTALSYHLHGIFGYGVTSKRETGLNFYHHAYDLGYFGWGFVCIGGQNGTCCVTIKGQGLLAAKSGWEQRLHDFLRNIPDARLTRIDLANDNFNSEVSLDDYLDMYKADLFTSRGRSPNVEQAGNWIRPNGKGRTLYIGSRDSGKLLRIYEKGLQLAGGFHDQFPNWVRVELELKNIDRVIPLDTLLRPGQYLAGAYPALSNMHKTQERITTFKNIAQSTFDKAIEITRHQFGKYIWAISGVLGIEETIARLVQGKEELPKNLIFETHQSFDETHFIHTEPVKVTTQEEILWQSTKL